MKKVFAKITRIALLLPLMGNLPALAASKGDYGRDANPIVCNQFQSETLAKAAELNASRTSARLLKAAEKGCINAAMDLLERGASIEARDRFANIALHHAAVGGHGGMIRLLLDKGAPIDRPNLKGSTPLLRAVIANKRKAVEILLAAGASTKMVGGNGVTPLAAAAFNGNDRIIKLLLEKNARPEETDGTGKGPIVYASSRGYISIVKTLLDAGLDINAGYKHHLTALHWAAGHGNDVPETDGVATVELLIERGSDLEIKDDRGRTPLMIAAERNHRLIVGALLAKGADIKQTDKAGKSASDLAASDEIRALLAQ